MELEVFGIGAAGNKAAIRLVERGILSKDNIKLFNTTTKDIPEEYKQDSDIVVPFVSSILGGCGKEPAKGKKAIEAAMNSGKIKLAELIKPTTKEIVLVTSIEGGTGSGATPSIAKKFIALNLPVHIFVFLGFQQDFRSIKNTNNFFSNMDDEVILHVIKNREFLDYTNNFTLAETLANEEFANQVEILKGNTIPSLQNIDGHDMYKSSTTAGFMDIKHIPLNNIKNKDMFNNTIIEAYTNSKTFDYEPTAKKVAVIINADEKTLMAIDSEYTMIKKYVGEPDELFPHIQYNGEDEQYIDIIAAGIQIPVKELSNIKKKYLEEKANRKKQKISYCDIYDDDDFDDDDDDMDMDVRVMNNPDNVDNFFKEKVGSNTPLNKVKVANNGIDSEY